jgi:hypothetical protein
MKRGPGVAGRAMFALHALGTAADERLGRRHHRRPSRPKHIRKEEKVEEQTIAVVGPSATEELQRLTAASEAKQREYDQLREQYHAMYQQRHEGTLPREQYPDYLWVEDRLSLLVREIEQLGPAVRAAQAATSVTEGVRHYNNKCVPVTEAATALCEAWATFIMQCSAFVQLADDQIRGLWSLPGADNQPAFDLPDGMTVLARMLQQFPHQPAFLHQSVVATLRVPMTKGDRDGALAVVPGKAEFPETLVRTFLKGYEVPNPRGAINGHS